MKNNQTLVASLVLVALALLYYVTQSGSIDTKSIKSDALSFDKSNIATIELTSSGSVLLFEQIDSRWYLDGYPVDTLRLNQAIDLFSDLSTDRLVTRKPEKHGQYELSESGSRFHAKSSEGKDLLNLLIGKRGANYQETFVREMNEDEVFAVKANLSVYKSKSQKDFWDRTITSLDMNNIKQVAMQGAINYTLNKGLVGWTFNGELVDTEKVMNLLRPLENLKASNFANAITPENTHYQNLIIQLENGEEHNLTFYLKDANGALLLVTASGNDKVFEYSKSSIDRMDADLPDLLPPGVQET